jgi:hypothetical protein
MAPSTTFVLCIQGLENWVAAARLAADCDSFYPDVEEEQIAEERVSCYNCRYRRWMVDAVSCMVPLS